MSEVAVSGKDKINAFDILDIDDFNDRIVGAYNSGIAEDGCRLTFPLPEV